MVTLYERKLFDKAGKHIKTSLYFDYYFHGQQRVRRFINMYLLPGIAYKKINKKTLELVTAMLIEENNKLATTKSIAKTLEKKLTKGLLKYLTEIIEDKGKNTLFSNLHYNLKHYMKYDIDLRDIDHVWINKWKKHLTEKSYLHTNTARAYFLKLSRVFYMAIREGYVDVHPFTRAEHIKEIGVKREYLTIDELKTILDMPGDEFKLIKKAFLFACFTGLRRSSIVNLMYSDIKNDSIQRYDEKTEDYEYFELSDVARMILKMDSHIVGLTGRVFDGLTYRNMQHKMEAFGAALPLDKHVTFHTARHTYATLLLTYGTDLYTVSKLLGHSNIQTTQKYANIIDAKKRAAVDALPALDVVGKL